MTRRIRTGFVDDPGGGMKLFNSCPLSHPFLMPSSGILISKNFVRFCLSFEIILFGSFFHSPMRKKQKRRLSRLGDEQIRQED